MKHAIPTEKLGRHAEKMAEAVSACVHCGFCLPDCPTYSELGNEADSPRGRIVLMKEVMEGNIRASQAQPHLDRCLGCLACETTCPSGVQYGELISPFRHLAEKTRKRTPIDKARRKFLLKTLPNPEKFRKAVSLARLTRPLRKFLPPALSAPLDLLPARLPEPAPLAPTNAAIGPRRARVALLAGCAQQVLAPGINAAAVRLLTQHGVEVIVPEGQVCCGALAWHVGDGVGAAAYARQNLSAFPGDVDAVVTTAAGCGSGLKDYPVILAGEAEEGAAAGFAEQVQDVTTFLASLDLAPPSTGRSVKVAYQDACHLLHAQGVRNAPRELLRSVPGLQLVELPEENICCGSAGTYNIDQPELAASLGERKAQLLVESGADMVATGNIGCLTQLRTHLEKLGADIPVRHTVEILADAWAGELA